MQRGRAKPTRCWCCCERGRPSTGRLTMARFHCIWLLNTDTMRWCVSNRSVLFSAVNKHAAGSDASANNITPYLYYETVRSELSMPSVHHMSFICTCSPQIIKSGVLIYSTLLTSGFVKYENDLASLSCSSGLCWCLCVRGRAGLVFHMCMSFVFRKDYRVLLESGFYSRMDCIDFSIHWYGV